MFPLHVCERIVAHIPIHRRHDLHALLLTNKTFHAAAEPIVYSSNVFMDIRRIHLFTKTLTKLNPRLARHVRTFGINLNDFFYKVVAASTSVHHAALLQVTQHEFWDDVQAALSLMERLQTLVLVEMTGLKIGYWTQILDSERSYPFALEEVRLHLAFDDHLVRFLNAQGDHLRVVHLYNTAASAEEDEEELTRSEELILPNVDTLDISISIAHHIRPHSLTHLTHLQLSFDSPSSLTKLSLSQLLHLLSNLILVPSRLRGLSLLELPPRLSTTSLFHHIINLTNTTLSHLSHLHLPAPYPSRAYIKSQFLACLIEFPRLTSIELSLDAWDPTSPSPSPPPPPPPPPPKTMGPGIPPPTSSPSQHPTDLSNTSPPPFQLPTQPTSQKALISELKTYCPTLRTIVLWYGKTRMRWAFISDGVPFQQSTSSIITGNKVLGGGGGGGVGIPAGESGDNAVECEMATTILSSSSFPPRIDNAALSGGWHYRMETNQWPGYSRLWHTS